MEERCREQGVNWGQFPLQYPSAPFDVLWSSQFAPGPHSTCTSSGCSAGLDQRTTALSWWLPSSHLHSYTPTERSGSAVS